MDVCIKFSGQLYPGMPTVQSAIHSMAVASNIQKYMVLGWLDEIVRTTIGWHEELDLTIESALESYKNGTTICPTRLLDCKPTHVELLKALLVDTNAYNKEFGSPTDGIVVEFDTEEDNFYHHHPYKFRVTYKVIEVPPSAPVPSPAVITET